MVPTIEAQAETETKCDKVRGMGCSVRSLGSRDEACNKMLATCFQQESLTREIFVLLS